MSIKNITDKNLHHAELRITSYTYSYSMNAEHFYGEVLFYNAKDKLIGKHELLRKITTEDVVRKLDAKDDADGLYVRQFERDGFFDTNRFSTEKMLF